VTSHPSVVHYFGFLQYSAGSGMLLMFIGCFVMGMAGQFGLISGATPDPARLLPLPLSAPTTPPRLSLSLGVLPSRLKQPTRRFRHLAPLRLQPLTNAAAHPASFLLTNTCCVTGTWAGLLAAGLPGRPGTRRAVWRRGTRGMRRGYSGGAWPG